MTFSGVYQALTGTAAVKVVPTQADISGGVLSLRLSRPYGSTVAANTMQPSDLVIARGGSGAALDSPLGSSPALAAIFATSNIVVITLGPSASILAGK